MTVRRKISLLLTKDVIFIFLLVAIISFPSSTLLAKLPFIGEELASQIGERVLIALATIIALLSYRYSVRANIRDTVNSIEPIEVDGYRVVPILHEVRWRPAILFGRLLHNDESHPKGFVSSIGLRLRPRTAIQLLIYDISDDERKMADSDQALGELRIDVESLRHKESKVYTDNLNFGLEYDIAAVRQTVNGLHISVFTNNPRQIKKMLQSIFTDISKNAIVSKKIEGTSVGTLEDS